MGKPAAVEIDQPDFQVKLPTFQRADPNLRNREHPLRVIAKPVRKQPETHTKLLGRDGLVAQHDQLLECLIRLYGESAEWQLVLDLLLGELA